MYDQSCSPSNPKRSWSDKIDQTENVTVKKTLQGLIKQRDIEFSCDISTGQYQSSSGHLMMTLQKSSWLLIIIHLKYFPESDWLKAHA